MSTRNQKLVAISGVTVVAFLAIVGLSVWAMGGDEVPPPDADPITIAKFLTTERWEDLIEPQKRPYMKTLRKNPDAITAALEQGKITKEEHDLAKHNIWLERQLDKMEDYYKLPPGPMRVQYLDDLCKRKLEKRKSPGPKNPNDPDTDEDSPFMEARKEEWPEDMEKRWDDFLDALEAREKLHGL